MLFLGFNKKIVAILTLLTMNMSLYSWRGRVIPVAFNKATHEWNILLGHDVNGFWSDFSLPGSPGQRGDLVAQQALSSQTNQFYTPSFTGAPWVKTPSNDILHVVKVPYATASSLRKQASNAVKDDFVWIPYSDFLNQGTVKRPLNRGGSVNVSHGVAAMIRAYLPSALTLLDKERLGTTSSTSQSSSAQSQGGQSWFGIPGAIYFYTKGKPYYEFTNFAEGYPFIINGEYWETSEHYYQAQKFKAYPALYKTIQGFRTDSSGSAAKKAFDFAQAHKAQVDPLWSSTSLDVMRTALKEKFNQNPPLRALLKKTGNAVLVEDSPVDSFFGVGAQGTGNNYLGRLLMELRSSL